MKILYAIQGTGNGHVSRARDIIPVLRQYGTVDVLLSGIQSDVEPGFEIHYRFKGLSLIFGKKGGVDIFETFRKSSLRSLRKEIHSLPVEQYQLVISDFEPVSAWACRQKGLPCIGLSHQAAVLDKLSPRAANLDPVGKFVLKHYAPVTFSYGFHFQTYAPNIHTPVIRHQVRALTVSDNGHYTVYLPAFSDERIVKTLSTFRQTSWHVFSKHTDRDYFSGNIHFQRISNKAFLESLASSKGVLCAAGFETPAEALFLRKKLMVVPMRGQFEQQCNAAALADMGVPVIRHLKKKSRGKIKEWLESDTVVSVDYPDCTEAVVREMMDAEASLAAVVRLHPDSGSPADVKDLRLRVLRKWSRKVK